MDRRLEYCISTEYEGMKISDFLKKKNYATSSITYIKYLEDGIMLNGQRHRTCDKLKTGDELIINYREDLSSPKIPPIKMDLDILYEDEDMIIINKPSDMPTHPSMNNYDNTLANALAYYFREQGLSFVFRSLNRLDRDTTGAVLVAKNGLAGSMLSTMVKARRIDKVYVALVRGKLEAEEGIIDVPIGRVPGSTIERFVDYENGQKAVTQYRVIEYDGLHNISYAEFKLHTGRTHQIRVHMKHMGHPLLGDRLYDPDNYDKEGLRRQALHCHRMSLVNPLTGDWVKVTAPLPSDMKLITG